MVVHPSAQMGHHANHHRRPLRVRPRPRRPRQPFAKAAGLVNGHLLAVAVLGILNQTLSSQASWYAEVDRLASLSEFLLLIKWKLAELIG